MQPRFLLILPALAAILGWPAADAVAADGHVLTPAEKIMWQPAPNGLPSGAEAVVLSGDPAVAGGFFVIRARMPDGYVVPPHWHAQAENVTVLSGVFKVGMGDVVAPDKVQILGPGGFFMAPPKMPHYAMFSGGTVIEISGIGPFDINYLNPKDDPRNKTGAAK